MADPQTPAPPKWYANVPRTFALVVRAAPVPAIAVMLIMLVEAFIPAASAWVAKHIVDGVAEAMQSKAEPMTGFRSVLPWLIAELVLITAHSVLSQIVGLLNHIIDNRVRFHVQTLVMGKAITLDLSYFENSDFYDMLQNATNQADWRAPALVKTTLSAAQSFITLLSFAGLIIAFNPWITLVLLVAVVPSFWAEKRMSELGYELSTRRAPERRKMMYYESLLTGNEYVKEIILFGLGRPLLARYLGFFGKWFKEDLALAKRQSFQAVALGLLGNVAYYGAYAWVVYGAVRHQITIGDMTMYLALFGSTQASFSSLLDGWNHMYEGGLFLNNLYLFLAVEPKVTPLASPRPMPEVITEGIVFENVTFQYPNRDTPALKDVSLHIRPGEKIALLGANGAGKSTFIKLLTRLYEPTSGRILLNGIDIREFDIDELRHKVSVVFQDFVKFCTTLSENIGFGRIEAFDDFDAIQKAAQQGGADDVAAEVPKGYDTMLGYWDDEATSLSGGQWQKVAIARAFMRKAEVLVLDEPTSAIDAEKEYELFKRFRTLTQGRISVLISHRFSTVRIADRIAVLEHGAITELGTHEELVKLNGTYARLFHLQAEGYR